MHQNKNQNKHLPVLSEAVLKYLDPLPGDNYLDLTAGYGGHAEMILGRTLENEAYLVDRDKNAVDYLRAKFKQKSVTICHQDFLEACRQLVHKGKRFDIILADLGVSSPHLNIAERGFSIQKDGPLDMRMDQSQKLTAETIVNNWSEAELTELFQTYGEEPKAGNVARQIVNHRPIRTTGELMTVLSSVWSRKVLATKRVHPATRVFQALRIAVNDELGQLSEALPLWVDKLLKPGGRLAIISFHSLEDRMVKQAFQDYSGDRYDATLTILTKHPETADRHEIVFNPRSRSAKLRAAVKK